MVQLPASAAALKRIRSRGDWHRPAEKQRQNIIAQRFHHCIGGHARCNAPRLRSVPLMPRITIEARAVSTGMTKHYHCIAGSRHPHIDSPPRSISAFEHSHLFSHSVSLYGSHGLSPGKACILLVPVLYRFLSELPAQQRRPAVHLERKIHQTRVDSLHLDAELTDF